MKTLFQFLVFSICGIMLPRYAAGQAFPVNQALEIGGMLPYLLEKEPVVNAPHKLVFFLNEGGTPVPESQAFRHIDVSFRDSVAGVVRLYYPSGKLYKSTPYASLVNGLKHGVETMWTENGQLLMRTEFYAGLASEITAYYPSGQVRTHMQKLPTGLKSESFDSLGRRGHYELPTRRAAGEQLVPQWVSEEERPAGKRSKQGK